MYNKNNTYNKNQNKKQACQFERKIQDKEKSEHPLFKIKFPTAINCLIGASLGDAIGAPLEFKEPRDIKKYFTPFTYSNSLSPQGLVHTDDTQMTISILESYICTGEFDNCYIKQLWVELGKYDYFKILHQPLKQYQKGGFRGTGPNFRETIDLLTTKGVDYDAIKNSSGNGVAMRSAPLAIYVYRFKPEEREEKLKQEVIKNTLLTSNSILAASSSFAYAYLLMKWLDIDLKFSSKSEVKQLTELYTKVKEFEEEACSMECFKDSDKKDIHLMSQMLNRLSKKVEKMYSIDDETIDGLYDIILDFSKKSTKSPIKTVNAGYALASVSSALITAICLKDYPFLTALRTVMIKGEDTDTVGSICGALIGAHKASKNEIFPFFVTQQLFDYNYLFDYYQNFLEFVINGQKNTSMMGEFILRENEINIKIARSPSDQRSEYYRSNSVKNIEMEITEDLFFYIKNNSDQDPEEMYEKYFEMNYERTFFFTENERKKMFSCMWKGVSKGSSYYESFKLLQKNIKESEPSMSLWGYLTSFTSGWV